MYRVKWSDPGPNKKIKKIPFPKFTEFTIVILFKWKTYQMCYFVYCYTCLYLILPRISWMIYSIMYPNIHICYENLFIIVCHWLTLTFSYGWKKIFSGIFRKIKMSAKLWHILRKRLNIRVNEYFRPTGGEQLTMVIAWLVATVCG